MRILTGLLVSLLLASGCNKEGCLTGSDPECEVPSPCQELSYTCNGGQVRLRPLQAGDPVFDSDNTASAAAVGDWLLQNDQVWVVIEALDHPHYIGPSGGNIVDMGVFNEDNDALRHIFTVTGLLPTEAAHYTEVTTFEGDDFAAVQVSGSLDGFPDIKIYTRYELRSCEPGVRVRTEIVNRTPDVQSWFLADGWYWGTREQLPFTPATGFDYPSFGLSTVSEAMRDIPFMVAGGRPEPAATYTAVACEDNLLTGIHSEDISAIGKATRLVMPRDYEVYERFIGVTDGSDISTGVDLALELRDQLYDEPYSVLSGRLSAPGAAAFGDPVRAGITVFEDNEARTPWSHVIPDDSGNFLLRLPANREYELEVEAFGQVVATKKATLGSQTVSVGTLEIPGVGEITLNATLDGEEQDLLVFVYPADDATEEKVRGRYLGRFESCAPILGHPHGGSPACNRVLVNGPTRVVLPEGEYWLAANGGPFTTLDLVKAVAVGSGTHTEVELALTTLPLQPAGTLAGDFHVHGSASFDSSIPDLDRVRAWLASGVQVLASTEHDVLWTYQSAIDTLDATDQLRVLTGIEITGHILFPVLGPEITTTPKVIGHWNAWPLSYDPEAPYNGGPWDELAQPGEIFDRLEAHGLPRADGVIQLNHPVGGLQFGRDYAWTSAIELDARAPLKTEFDGTGNSVFLATPPGATHSNADYHAQEVMSGTNNLGLLPYRALWHYLLNEGVLRAGTANSDSHSLTEMVMGVPLTLVYSDNTVESFDSAGFNQAIRAGRMSGTNGPVIEISTTDADGVVRTPALEAFVPSPDSVLTLRVVAAPWVPISEVRIVVNGEVVRTLGDLYTPDDPLGMDLTPRLQAEIPLADLILSGADSWLSVEAGAALEPNADLDCDGLPDTGDNNNDGQINRGDVEEVDVDVDKDGCLSETGPLKDPDPPRRGTREHTYRLVTPDGYPFGFTNPLVIDGDGGGYQGVSR